MKRVTCSGYSTASPQAWKGDDLKVLVTGGAGFIGSHVAEAYLKAGAEVVVVDDLSRGRREHVPAGARFVRLDICDREGVEALFARERCELVNHHAAQIDVRRSVADPHFDCRCNLLGLLNLLEAARAHGVRGFVFVSSGGVIYGEPAELPVPETAPKRPLSPYGVSKLAGEHYLYAYRHLYGLRYVALRYANVYGPRQDPHGEAGVVAIFGRALLAGRPPTVFGDGEQTRDYVYVTDVAELNVRASERLEALCAAAGPELDALAFNVGTGRETSVNALYRALAELTGRKGEPRHAPARAGELRRNALAIAKARETLGFVPRHDLEAGLRATLAWLRAAGV